VKNCHILHYCFAWTSAEQRRQKVEFYESVHGPSEYINYVYAYEDSQYTLRRCRESWRNGVPEVQSRFDPLLERIRIRIWSRLLFPFARMLAAWRLRRGRRGRFAKNPG
jgi:hypothetical protein